MLSDFAIARNALRERGFECYLVDGTNPPVYDVVYRGEHVLSATKDYIITLAEKTDWLARKRVRQLLYRRCASEF